MGEVKRLEGKAKTLWKEERARRIFVKGGRLVERDSQEAIGELKKRREGITLGAWGTVAELLTPDYLTCA